MIWLAMALCVADANQYMLLAGFSMCLRWLSPNEPILKLTCVLGRPIGPLYVRWLEIFAPGCILVKSSDQHYHVVQ